jgi:hypothetical protein
LDLLGSVNIVCIIILNKWLGKLRGRRSSPEIKGDVLSAGDDPVADPLKKYDPCAAFSELSDRRISRLRNLMGA